MFLLISFILASSFYSSTAASIIAGVICLAVGGVATAWIHQRRGKMQDKKEEEKTANEKLDGLIAQSNEMHRALVGEEKTALNPNPPLGLVKQVGRIERTLFENGGAGNTMLDRIDRIERGQKQAASATLDVAATVKKEAHQAAADVAQVVLDTATELRLHPAPTIDRIDETTHRIETKVDNGNHNGVHDEMDGPDDT